LDETALTDSVGVFLQGLFQPGMDGFGAAGKEFAAAITTAAAAQRD
jgi:hypothetical protein